MYACLPVRMHMSGLLNFRSKAALWHPLLSYSVIVLCLSTRSLSDASGEISSQASTECTKNIRRRQTYCVFRTCKQRALQQAGAQSVRLLCYHSRPCMALLLHITQCSRRHHAHHASACHDAKNSMSSWLLDGMECTYKLVRSSSDTMKRL